MNLSKRQEAELVTAIQGRGEIPLKFVYLGEGAGNWAAIARDRSSSEGGINSVEGSLLQRRLNDFISTLNKSHGINILDIGCGDGNPILPVLNTLKKMGLSFKYVPIDISNEMLTLAVKNVQAALPDVMCQPHQLDFELGQFSDITYELKKNGSANLMFFLGSTLGNFSDLNRVLTNFRDSMTSRDFLIIGVELTNLAKVSSIIAHNYEGGLVRKFTTYVWESLGTTHGKYKFDVSWNEKDSQVEIRAILSKPVEIRIADERFMLVKDENILLARSIKFTEYTVTKLFSDVGFRTELLTTSEDRGYLLTMVQPTRYSV